MKPQIAFALAIGIVSVGAILGDGNIEVPILIGIGILIGSILQGE